MRKLVKELNNEKGSLALTILALFFILSLLLYGIYKVVIMDYVVTTSSLEKKDDRLKQENLIESLLINYRDDMMNDVTYADMEEKLIGEEEWKPLYSTYMFDYKKFEDDDLGDFGKFKWEEFENYNEGIENSLTNEFLDTDDDSIEPEFKIPVRTYEIFNNWDGKDMEIYEESIDPSTGNPADFIWIPKSIYVKVSNVEPNQRVTFSVDTPFTEIDETTGGTKIKTYDIEFIGGYDEILKLESLADVELPETIKEIRLKGEAGSSLGNVKLSILTSREFDIIVAERNILGEKEGSDKLIKTVKVELGKKHNKVGYKELK